MVSDPRAVDVGEQEPQWLRKPRGPNRPAAGAPEAAVVVAAQDAGLEPSDVLAWTDLATHRLVVEYGPTMVFEGLTPARCRTAVGILGALPEPMTLRALAAAVHSGISLANLDVWARVIFTESQREADNALPPRARAGRRGATGPAWPEQWVSTARRYLNALPGQQRIAAWAAAAGLSAVELQQASTTALDPLLLETQAALAWLDLDDAPPLNWT